jgi:hypothetical protein
MKISRIVFFLLTFLTLSNQAFALVSFSVKNEEIPKTKILFFGFDSADPRLKSDSFAILERIRKNLKTTDLFEILKQDGHLEISQSNNVVSASLNENLVQENLSVESIPNFEKYAILLIPLY